MPSTAKIFGAALLHSLGKGVEGVGEGRKNYRDYALDQLTKSIALEKSRPNLLRDTEAYMGMTPEQQAAYEKIKPAPYGPQPPAQIQVADVVADIEAIPEDKRTPAQKSKLEQLKKPDGKLTKPNFSKK